MRSWGLRIQTGIGSSGCVYLFGFNERRAIYLAHEWYLNPAHRRDRTSMATALTFRCLEELKV